jgi:hypothetical protein
LFFGGFTALILFGILINVFNGYLWRKRVGTWMFRLIGLAAPPDLNGEYSGTIDVYSATGQGAVFRTGYFMRISQTWEQLDAQPALFTGAPLASSTTLDAQPALFTFVAPVLPSAPTLPHRFAAATGRAISRRHLPGGQTGAR